MRHEPFVLLKKGISVCVCAVLVYGMLTYAARMLTYADVC